MITVNLIDEGVLTRRRRIRRLRRWGLVTLAAAVVAATPVLLELSRHRTLLSLAHERRRLDEHIQTTQARLNQAKQDVQQLEGQIARADALRTKRSWWRLLGQISQTLPEDIWLMSVGTDTPEAGSGIRRAKEIRVESAGTPAAEGREVVTLDGPRMLLLEGYSLQHQTIYEFMSRLNTTGMFGDVQLTLASEGPVLASEAVRFSVICRW